MTEKEIQYWTTVDLEEVGHLMTEQDWKDWKEANEWYSRSNDDDLPF